MTVSNKKANKQTGNLGEYVATMFLMKHGFSILNRNYLKKWGEIDIVARGTDDRIHFIEVKSVSYETKAALDVAVTHETWRPEELVHERKLHQIHKAIESWLQEHKYDGEWQIDVVTVRMVPQETFAVVNVLQNV